MENFSPAISVIVPVYNAEKYLSVCLESILIQTFTDFELLVVDDCSTDSSYAIAESYLECFGGRMKIISLPENTGSGSVPRNVGLDLSRGKYVYFVDNDDLLIDSALEELFNAAEEFQADVVYMDTIFTCDYQPVPTKLNVKSWHCATTPIDKPTPETSDIFERIVTVLCKKFQWPPWTKFLRRSLLIDNRIKFPKVILWEDVSWTFNVLCQAKKILRIPNVLYIYRQTSGSLLNHRRTAEESLIDLSRSLTGTLKYIDEFMRNVKIFQKDPELFLRVLQIFAEMILFDMECFAKKIPPKEVYDIFCRAFSADDNDYAALISYLLVMNNIYSDELQKRTK